MCNNENSILFMITGDNGKKIKCKICPYTTFSRQHLSRHLKTVHNEAPVGNSGGRYFCRLCSFNCASMDNLRKHILKTTKHPNCQVYECHLCSFKSNARLDFKSHLIRAHPHEKAGSIVDDYFSNRRSTDATTTTMQK